MCFLLIVYLLIWVKNLIVLVILVGFYRFIHTICMVLKYRSAAYQYIKVVRPVRGVNKPPRCQTNYIFNLLKSLNRRPMFQKLTKKACFFTLSF